MVQLLWDFVFIEIYAIVTRGFVFENIYCSTVLSWRRMGEWGSRLRVPRNLNPTLLYQSVLFIRVLSLRVKFPCFSISFSPVVCKTSRMIGYKFVGRKKDKILDKKMVKLLWDFVFTEFYTIVTRGFVFENVWCSTGLTWRRMGQPPHDPIIP